MMVRALLGTAVAGATLPGTAELLLLTLGGVLPSAPRPKATRRLRRLVTVVPAHDEEAGIGACVRSLQRADRPQAPCDLVVIADNCTDATAARALEAGATVWERRDPTRRGKGYALEFAFQQLLENREVDAVLIVDADTEVAANFLTACEQAFAAGADAVQVPYLVRDPGDAPRARLMNVAFMAFNVLRPRGRERLGLSVGILGNGWGLSRRCLEQVPYRARSVVEDLEHHLALVQAGFRVRFVGDTAVRAEMPAGDAGSETQRARWEGGRLRMAREQVPRLLARAVRSGEPACLEPAFELMLMPLSFHLSGLGLALAIPFPPTQLYALFGLGVVAAHLAGALAVGGATRKDLEALLGVPRYVLWKAGVLPKIIDASGAHQPWVRTARDAAG